MFVCSLVWVSKIIPSSYLFGTWYWVYYIGDAYGSVLTKFIKELLSGPTQEIEGYSFLTALEDLTRK